MSKSDYYSRLWEYLLVISPPDYVKHSIGQIKKEVDIKYGSAYAVHSAAHISLLRFLLVKGFEKSLLSQLFSFLINKIPIEIILKNFDVFPRHTLFIQVKKNEQLNRLQIGLIRLVSFIGGGPGIKPLKNYYMTIARNLSPAQFESVSEDFRHKELGTSFLAENAVLLKRPYNEFTANNCRWTGSHNFPIGI